MRVKNAFLSACPEESGRDLEREMVMVMMMEMEMEMELAMGLELEVWRICATQGPAPAVADASGAHFTGANPIWIDSIDSE
jgi:hypothetical protein